ncbi:aldehyde dehydrogenase family protein [Candidatus Kaiserbacteria bacterium]|nr:aldehyde dehydrogenase family protein [Candidatus Kaiserbacteria bacterium]
MTRAQRVTNVFEKVGFNGLESGTSDGRSWLGTPHSPRLISYDPTTGESLGSVAMTTAVEYAEVVNRAKKTFLKWREVPAPKRAELIRDVGTRLTELKEPLAELIAIEMGKTVKEAAGEIGEGEHMCEFVQGLARQLGGLPIQSERPKHRMMEQYHPLGIVGTFSAFNFPLAVLFWNRVLALLCGNVDIWKPSSLTPFVSIAIQRIWNDICTDHGHPGIASLVIGRGEDVGTWMLEDKSIPLISFTGSTETGRIVAQTVAGRFGKMILELGGNNAVIVEPDADFDIATSVIKFGVIGTAGQRCTTTRRVIVHESIKDTLIERLVHAFEQVKIGDPLDEDTLMGPLINESAQTAMLKALVHAGKEGGKPVYVGAGLGINHNFVFPNIVCMPSQSDIVKKETFAPILYVMTYKTLEEAIAMNNDVPQGLSSSIITNSFQSIEHFLSVHGSDCGIANVNCAPSGAEIGGAFGGEKETGGGREAGSDSWKQYMRRQTSTLFWGKADESTLAQGIKFDVEETEKSMDRFYTPDARKALGIKD